MVPSSLLPLSLTDLGISSSVDEQTRSENRSDSSGGGLSSRIRRRFSRDARDLYRRPYRSGRGPKIPFLHFASKPGVHPAQIAAYDLGSSLMSERGYDSDAQYIKTPKHPTYTTEYSTGRPRNGMAISPRRPPAPLREPGMEFPREQAFGLAIDSRGSANEQPPYHWEQTEPHHAWRSRDHEYRIPQQLHESPYSSFHNVDLGMPRGKQLSPSPSISRAWAQERPAPGFGLRLQEIHLPHTPVGPGRSVVLKNSSADIAIQRAGYGYEAAPSGYHNHHIPQQQAYTTSAESVYDCPPQLSIRKGNQRPRREIAADEQSVHLGEMNIPRMLASSGSTSNLMGRHPEFDEYQPGSNAGTWAANRYQGTNHPMAMAPIWDATERSAGDQDPRSPYSPKNSVSSAGIDYEQNFSDCPRPAQKRAHVPLHHPENSFQSEKTRDSNPAQSAENCTAGENQGLTSRFTDKLESNRSVGVVGLDSHEENSAASPRKTSIGWLSDGRRVGYGFTLVPPEHTSEPGLLRSPEYIKDSPKGSKPAEHDLSDNQGAQQTIKSSKGMSKTSESSFDISAMLQRLNLPRWTGASFALKTSNNSDAGSCDPGGSALFGILSIKKKPHEEIEPHVETENPWEFCSWVRPSRSLGEQQAAGQDSSQSRELAEAQLIDKLATLRRRGGAWATKRKVSEIARNIERRAVAKLAASAEQFPVVQRTATRVLRLKGPGSKDLMGRIYDDKPIFSASQVDGNEDPGGFRAAFNRRTSSASSGDWNSLYEECLEKRSIPE
ncbi:hypothetical protein BJY01DRAFT_244436 [Aspergillus pseudoustus]|uniref:Uncharacterized protein n=1 Tax=Aspergillus pseudoustus TaxID=1810923 RepID=A0ABR4KKQ2_9EURO